MPPKGKRTSTDFVFVFGDDSMTGAAMDFFIQLDEHSVLEDGYPRRRDELVSFEFRRDKNHIIGLPLSGRPRDIHQGRGLAINGAACAIRIDLLVERIEDLDFKKVHEHDPVVPAIIPRPFKGRRPHPFDMKLNAAKRIFGREVPVAGYKAAIRHFPIVGRVPFGEVLAVKQDDPISRHGRRRPGPAGVDAFCRRSIRIMHQPLTPGQTRRVFIAVNTRTIFGVNEICGWREGRQQDGCGGYNQKASGLGEHGLVLF